MTFDFVVTTNEEIINGLAKGMNYHHAVNMVGEDGKRYAILVNDDTAVAVPVVEIKE